MGKSAKNVSPADLAAAARLKQAWLAMPREHRPTQQQLADAWEGPGEANQSLISQYMNGRIALNYRALLSFAKALGIDPADIRKDLPEQQLAPRTATDHEWAEVRGTDQAVALGDGAAPEDYAETHKLKFRASSLRRKGLRPDRLEVYYGDGDSMEPRIRKGDAILFDTSDARILDDRIYVIRYEGHVYAKRLQHFGEHVAIVSDNRDDPKWRKPVLVRPSDDFEVLGRVRWIGSWED
jgi:phage repressor protein C with HTH and peptisase S24 domain